MNQSDLLMLPQAYELPVAGLLVLGGVIACFAGYRLFRFVLGVYGFFLGALLTSSLVGVTNTFAQILAAIAGGLTGALILVMAYFVGIALVGAGLGALVVHVIWGQTAVNDPPALAVILASVAGAIVAMVLQRYVIIVGTAFSGAWTMLVGGIEIAAALGQKGAAAARGSDAWILYPIDPAPGQRWVPVVWVILGIAGTAVQLGVTGKKR